MAPLLPPQNILILGASGMLGGALFSKLPTVSENYTVFGTHRGHSLTPKLNERMHLLKLDDVFQKDSLLNILTTYKIDVVINAIGLIKQIGSELSVFSGQKGNYSEDDIADARDIYGLTKLIGEVTDNQNAVTIRTSIIGHESGRAASLIDWFLSQADDVKGFRKAIFSGFPTIYLAHIIGRFILPNPELNGLYHVSANPIDKFTLLSLVAEVYQHKVNLIPHDDFVIDRSLNSSRFKTTTGFVSPEWPELINIMKSNPLVWTHNEH